MTANAPAALRRAIADAMRRRTVLPAEVAARIMVEQLGSPAGALDYLGRMGEIVERPWWAQVRAAIETRR